MQDLSVSLIQVLQDKYIIRIYSLSILDVRINFFFVALNNRTPLIAV